MKCELTVTVTWESATDADAEAARGAVEEVIDQSGEWFPPFAQTRMTFRKEAT